MVSNDPRRALTPEQVREARRLRAAGLSFVRIAEALGWPAELRTITLAATGQRYKDVK